MISDIITVLDFMGTFVFAITGAMVAISKKMDIYGVCILGILTAIGGGVLRDALLGITPPAAFNNFLYLVFAISGSLVAWFFFNYIKRQERLIRIFDAVGLALFTVIGAQVGLSKPEVSWYAAIGMGILTGTGGGMIRDVLAAQVPFVLRKEVYAIASLFGAGLYVFLVKVLMVPEIVSLGLGMALVLGIRLLAILKDWNLPQEPPRSREGD